MDLAPADPAWAGVLDQINILDQYKNTALTYFFLMQKHIALSLEIARKKFLKYILTVGYSSYFSQKKIYIRA